MAKHHGFTLIELLVAIAIISVLVGILLPALGQAKDTAANAQCKSQVRQIFVAQTLYAQDHGVFTTIWVKDDGSYSEGGGEPVKTKLQTYLGMSEDQLQRPDSVLQCPAISEEELIRNFDNRYANSRPSSIGINGAMHFERWQFKQDQVPEPSKIIVISEQAVEPYEEALSSDGVGVLTLLGGETYWKRVTTHDPSRGYRHGVDGNNVAMADGHVEQLAHDALAHESGHWFWWDVSEDEFAIGGETCGCTKPGGSGGSPM